MSRSLRQLATLGAPPAASLHLWVPERLGSGTEGDAGDSSGTAAGAGAGAGAAASGGSPSKWASLSDERVSLTGRKEGLEGEGGRAWGQEEGLGGSGGSATASVQNVLLAKATATALGGEGVGGSGAVPVGGGGEQDRAAIGKRGRQKLPPLRSTGITGGDGVTAVQGRRVTGAGEAEGGGKGSGTRGGGGAGGKGAGGASQGVTQRHPAELPSPGSSP